MSFATRAAALAALTIASIVPVASQTSPHGRIEKPEKPAPTGAAPSQATTKNEQPAASGAAKLPPDKTTRHSLQLPNGQILKFRATAGAIRLTNLDKGAPLADIAYIAFQREDAEKTRRPVTFAMNGGPGYASAWLNLGALGPWRLPMDGESAYPSAPTTLSPNAETWLTFTDLVFLDPAGTGYSRVLGGDDVRKQLWSVDGDIDSLSATIRRWVEENDRMASPKYIAGESYGGFRAPKIAHDLQVDQGVGINGVVLVSPVLDFGRFSASGGLFSHVGRLPSYAAARLATQGEPVTREKMAEIEAYARGPYLNDLMQGLKDEAALERLTRNVADLTGLAPDLVRRHAGRIPLDVFIRQLKGDKKMIASMYDATVLGIDPSPYSQRPEADDQMRLGLHAPIVQAMLSLYRDRLEWTPEKSRYLFSNERASRRWNWKERSRQESVSALAGALALDPHMGALIVHGVTDLVTPYFETRLTLDQMPPLGDPNRLRFVVYSGGHMFYSVEESRKRFRDDAKALIQATMEE